MNMTLLVIVLAVLLACALCFMPVIYNKGYRRGLLAGRFGHYSRSH